jgi:hypothetical protein
LQQPDLAKARAQRRKNISMQAMIWRTRRDSNP